MRKTVFSINMQPIEFVHSYLSASERDAGGQLDEIEATAVNCDTKPAGPNRVATRGQISVDRGEVRGVEFAQ